ncbi:unnamed protein product [Prunus brigantina]
MIGVFGFTDVLLKASFCHLDGHPTTIQDMTGLGVEHHFPCFICGPMREIYDKTCGRIRKELA